MKRNLFAALALFSGCVEPVLGQHADVSSAIRDEIRGVYSFRPHTLTGDQIDQKSKVLDVFWKKVKSGKSAYLPVLKSELQKPEAQPFFLYDGSMLLLQLSDTAENRRVALQAIARCDLRDIQPTEYLRQVHRLASMGENTAAAAFHILSDPKFQAIIPQHALTLGQNYSLIYMLLPTDDANWLRQAAKLLESEANVTAQKSLLLLLWYAQTKESDSAITDFAAIPGKPAASRDYARELLARKNKVPREIVQPMQSEGSIRNARRKLMKRISDEALIELDEKTLQLVMKRR